MPTLPPTQPRTHSFLRHLLAVCALTAVSSLSAFAGETTNAIGITMVDIPAGSFLMGSGNDSKADASETPQHRVSIREFQMGKTEVTLGQFKRYIAAAGRSDLLNEDFIKYNTNGENAPVVQVNWNGAQAFIAWLNKSDGGGWRLPSEAEWEYACRAGGNGTYCGGDNINAVAWFDGNSGNRAHAVGTKAPNAFGLYDMSGNVWEWVQDWKHDDYKGAPTDGSAWVTGGNQRYRVQRGGSWSLFPDVARAASRNHNSPGDPGTASSGLRLARTR